MVVSAADDGAFDDVRKMIEENRRKNEAKRAAQSVRNAEITAAFEGVSVSGPPAPQPPPPPQAAAPAAPAEAPPPVVVSLPAGAPVFSIDVECVASGVQHHDRAVGSIALVDGDAAPKLHLLVRQEGPVASYLTPLTGLTAERCEAEGVPLQEALATLRANLPPAAILVGQNINKDVEWLGLVEGEDYAMQARREGESWSGPALGSALPLPSARLLSHPPTKAAPRCPQVDLAALLKVWNPRFGKHTYFGQDHYAAAWLGAEAARADGEAHDALTDATVSMRLFRAYTAAQHDAAAVAAAGARALATPPKPSFAKLNPEYEGCCMGNKQTCRCGAPFFS